MPGQWGKKPDPFYLSTAWKKCRLVALERDAYLCQPCLRRKRLMTANTVHHIKPRLEHPELALELDNLESICPACHNKEHSTNGVGARTKKKENKRRAQVVVSMANKEVW